MYVSSTTYYSFFFSIGTNGVINIKFFKDFSKILSRERKKEGAGFRERNLSKRELCQVLAICRLSTGPSGNQTYRGVPVYRCQPKTAEFAVVLRT